MRFTAKEKEAILKEPFEIWPPNPNKPDEPRGPISKNQKMLFLERIALKDFSKLPHTHSQDITLLVGGRRSGKSALAAAFALDQMIRHPGTRVLCGAKTYADLKDNIMPFFKDRLTINEEWDHPLVAKKPNDNNKALTLINGSRVRFIHYDEWERLRGKENEIVIMDELSQLDHENAFLELIRGQSGSRIPILHVIACSNIPENRSHWMFQTFKLYQYFPNFDPAKREHLSKLCNCHVCNKCLNNHNKMVPWNKDNTCPECNFKRPLIKIPNPTPKDPKNTYSYYCKGQQDFWRVLVCSVLDNDSLPPAYIDSVRSSSPEDIFNSYMKGDLSVELGSNKVYYNHRDTVNVLKKYTPLDWTKPIHWTLDFNTKPQCSLIIQKTETGPLVVDGFTIFKAGPQEVAEAFIERYKGFTETVYIYGDPSAYSIVGAVSIAEKTKFQVIYDLLTQAGFIVKLKATSKKPPLKERLDNTNILLFNNQGLPILKINPQVDLDWRVGTKALQMSLEGTNWSKTKPNSLDDTPDKNAARSSGERAYAMTHPGDALGYFLFMEYPLIKEYTPTPWFQVPNEYMVEVKEGKVVEHNFKPQKETNRVQVIKQEDIPPPPPQQSFGEMLGIEFGEADSSFYW